VIVVDTSALMAIVLNEPAAERCAERIASDPDICISAATVAEALIVAAQRQVGAEMEALIGGLSFEVIPVTEPFARQVAAAYAQWGKGNHPAGLNFGDCFAYVAAKERACDLLYVGDDFSRAGFPLA
jgi:ribonuclease VapC